MFECSKNIFCSFWSPACDGRALLSRPAPTPSHTGCWLKVTPKATVWAAPVQRLPLFCSHPTRPTHPAVANHESIWSVHCHSQGLSVVSKPSSSLNWSTLEMPWTRKAQHFRTGTFIPLGLIIGSVWPMWFANEACFPPLCQNIWWCRSFATQSMAPRSTTSASLGNLLEMQSFKLHPQPTDQILPFTHLPRLIPIC